MIRNIQGLRAAAAVLVVFVHLGALLGALGLPAFGGGGVDLFFVISGFIMVHTTRARPPTAGAFVRNRLARIAPFYWLMTLSVFLVALVAPQVLGASEADPAQLVKSLLFIPFVKANGLVEPVLFVGWTLNLEVFFYALFALGLAMRSYAAGVGFVLLTLASLTVVGRVVRPQSLPEAFYTSPLVAEFALGMAAALATDAAPLRAPASVRWATAAGVAAAALVLLTSPYVWPAVPPVLFSAVCATVVVAGAVLLERWGWSLRSAAIMALGDASYALYLSHPYVTQSVQKLARPFHPQGATSVVLIGVALALAIALALALHAWVERPLLAAARATLGARRMPERPA